MSVKCPKQHWSWMKNYHIALKKQHKTKTSQKAHMVKKASKISNSEKYGRRKMMRILIIKTVDKFEIEHTKHDFWFGVQFSRK